MKKGLFFLTILFLFNSCLGNFTHNTKEKIIGKYYIIATDVKSQATISIYEKNYNSYIGITPEGISEYVVINDSYIIAKSKKGLYYLIRIGEEFSKKYNSKKINDFLVNKKINMSSIEWKKV
jgi:hypothetical protein